MGAGHPAFYEGSPLPLANRREKDAAGHLNDPMTSIEARPVGFKELFRFIWKTITLSLPSRAVEPWAARLSLCTCFLTRDWVGSSPSHMEVVTTEESPGTGP